MSKFGDIIQVYTIISDNNSAFLLSNATKLIDGINVTLLNNDKSLFPSTLTDLGTFLAGIGSIIALGLVIYQIYEAKNERYITYGAILGFDKLIVDENSIATCEDGNRRYLSTLVLKNNGRTPATNVKVGVLITNNKQDLTKNVTLFSSYNIMPDKEFISNFYVPEKIYNDAKDCGKEAYIKIVYEYNCLDKTVKNILYFEYYNLEKRFISIINSDGLP